MVDIVQCESSFTRVTAVQQEHTGHMKREQASWVCPDFLGLNAQWYIKNEAVTCSVRQIMDRPSSSRHLACFSFC